MTDLDEPIHLSAYDPKWPNLFEAEVQRLSLGLPADVSMEHIGSTSVPGLLAKPSIDIMVGTEAHHNLEAVRKTLVDLGYEDLGEAGVQVASIFVGGRMPLSTSHWYGAAARFGLPISPSDITFERAQRRDGNMPRRSVKPSTAAFDRC